MQLAREGGPRADLTNLGAAFEEGVHWISTYKGCSTPVAASILPPPAPLNHLPDARHHLELSLLRPAGGEAVFVGPSSAGADAPKARQVLSLDHFFDPTFTCPVLEALPSGGSVLVELCIPDVPVVVSGEGVGRGGRERSPVSRE